MRARLARKALGLIDSSELERHYRGAFVANRVEPLHVQDAAGTDRLSEEVTEAIGIDLRVDEQLERLTAWTERGTDVFAAIRADRKVNLTGPTDGPVSNDYYPTPDAEVYASLILDLAPGRIVEVGGGFSTLVARHAIERSGLDTALVVVDPEPRTEVRAAASELVQQRVETLAMEDLAVRGGDILFIDSSHVVRTGGDLPHLLLEIVPRLQSGAVVHVHDIYLPYGYASEYAKRLWTEQYLVQALLSGSTRYDVVFATHMMSRRHPNAMREAFGPSVGTTPVRHGASFWFTVR